MPTFGFSTGALALGDYRRGLQLLRGTDSRAVELSALRDHELPALMADADNLDLEQFDYVAVHAPSRFAALTEEQAATLLLSCVERRWRVVIHPDAIGEPMHWRPFGTLLCVENMDKRKRTGRTASELARFFEVLPEASLCLDLAHARQIDTTLAVARLILTEFGGERLAQVHLSELDSRSQHFPLSMGTVSAIQKIAHWLEEVPVILESRVAPDQIQAELRMAALCFERQEGARRPAPA